MYKNIFERITEQVASGGALMKREFNDRRYISDFQ
jgi:hypothetical protein